eukprot:TRINITY_DN3056_c0_g5_i1.p2 TRINITY_DN3056_c0_g5~~TRINITY_DN3056_c0_g5_i1.p2  ORF type:complete len:197 (+),score=-9.39 TRINITY_DN3056_c0_g5_i1:174-764(+)
MHAYLIWHEHNTSFYICICMHMKTQDMHACANSGMWVQKHVFVYRQQQSSLYMCCLIQDLLILSYFLGKRTTIVQVELDLEDYFIGLNTYPCSTLLIIYRIISKMLFPRVYCMNTGVLKPLNVSVRQVTLRVSVLKGKQARNDLLHLYFYLVTIVCVASMVIEAAYDVRIIYFTKLNEIILAGQWSWLEQPQSHLQ